MKKKKNLIVVIILIIILSLIILFGKNFIMRQYFIYKIENVDYDEYILTTSLNGKKTNISYYSDDIHIFRKYDKNGNLNNVMKIYDYDKNISYEYTINNKNYSKNKSNFCEIENMNNFNLLSLLKNEEEKKKFIYKGIEQINNRECYILLFEKDKEDYKIIYLDKELLYTIREEDNYLTLDYDLDFNLQEKYLFEFEL